MTIYHQPITPTDVVGRSPYTHGLSPQIAGIYNTPLAAELLAELAKQQQQQLQYQPLQQQQPQPDTASRADSGLQPNDTINSKWRLLSRIGRGAFGDIWLAEPINQYAEVGVDVYGKRLPKYVAIKLEKLHSNDTTGQPQRAVLKLETIVLKSLQKYDNTASALIEYGKSVEHSVAYLVMSLLGDNLLKLRKKRPHGRFTLPTALRFGIAAISAIRAIHTEGYIHRDIKPSNFVIGQDVWNHSANCNDQQNIYMIDFGLARAYRDRHTGNVLDSRGSIAGFRGTPRYASVHVHQNMDLGRRDDMWSLLYIMIEFISGDLPWGHIRDKDAIGSIKQQYMDNPRLLLRNTTSCLMPFYKHLASLQFGTQPDYEYLISLLQTKYASLHIPSNYPFDWEVSGATVNAQTTETCTVSHSFDQNAQPNNTDVHMHQQPQLHSPAISPVKHTRVERVSSVDAEPTSAAQAAMENDRTLGKKQLYNTMILPAASPAEQNASNTGNSTDKTAADGVQTASSGNKPGDTDTMVIQNGVLHVKYMDQSPSSMTDMNHTDQHWNADDNKQLLDQVLADMPAQAPVPIQYPPQQYNKHLYAIHDNTVESVSTHQHGTAPRIFGSLSSNIHSRRQSLPPAIDTGIHHPHLQYQQLADDNMDAVHQLEHVTVQPTPPSGPAPTFSHISKSFGRFAKKLLPHKHRISPTALQQPIVS